jgi:hypothetical protein
MCWLATLCLPGGTITRPQSSSETCMIWEGTSHPLGDRLLGQQTTRRVTLRGYYACRSISQTSSRVKSSGDAASLRTVARLSACKDAHLFDPSSGPFTSLITFSTLREIARSALVITRNNRRINEKPGMPPPSCAARTGVFSRCALASPPPALWPLTPTARRSGSPA